MQGFKMLVDLQHESGEQQVTLGDHAMTCFVTILSNIINEASDEAMLFYSAGIYIVWSVMVWWLFEGEKWQRRDDRSEMLVIIDGMLKAVKNMGYFSTLGKYSDPVYALGLSIADGFFNRFRVEAREVQHHEVIPGLVV
eukprot:g41861.t1